MSKITWEDLKNKNIVIHTPTEDLMKKTIDSIAERYDDFSYEEFKRKFYDPYDEFKENTCVNIDKNTQSWFTEDINHYVGLEYQIVEYEDVRHLFETERIVKPNQIYRHFKGKYYATLGVSTPISEREFSKLLPVHHMKQVYHTELERNIMIIQKYNKLYHRDIFSEDELVIYTPLYFSDYPIYARPKNMFLSKTDLNKHPEATQEYRMELVK